MKINHHAARPASIEPLESRIAPAAVFTYTDVDGDDVTIKTSKGTNVDLGAILTRVPTGLGEELQRIDFSAAPLDAAGKSIFHGTNLTVTAKRTAAGGDGLVNVGYIDASGGTSLDLGVVTIRGDLGQIDAGDATTSTAAVKGLSVQSMGQFGTSTQGMAPSLESNLTGALGYLKVAGNIKDAYVNVGGGADGKIGSVTISGSLIGGTGANGGRIFSTGAMGPVNVVGHVEGGMAAGSGSIVSDSPIARVTLGGSILGSYGNSSGRIYSSAALGPVKIAGDIVGGKNVDSGVVSSGGSLAGVNLGGSLFAGSQPGAGAITSTGAMGPVKIGGSVAGGSYEESGSIESSSTLAAVTVVGSLIGGAGTRSGTILSDGAMAAVKIGGGIEGGDGTESGRISTGSTLAGLTVGGSVRGGDGTDSGTVSSAGAMGAVKILGDVKAGAEVRSGRVVSLGTLASFTLGGSLLGGSFTNTGEIIGEDGIGVIKITGDVRGGFGGESGLIASNGAVARVTIAGSLIGGYGNRSGGIECGGALGPVRIDRNLIGGDGNGFAVVEDTGFIGAQRLASLVVGGSIIAGHDLVIGGGFLIRSAAVHVADDIGPITVKGSLIGNRLNSVVISARGQAVPGTTTDVAIKSLTVGGRVEWTDILAGYDTDAFPSGVNADAQIGPVIVGGDWSTSNLVAGVQDDADARRDDSFGEGDDQAIAGGSGSIVSKIASILIKGTALGTVGGVDFFGFVAQQIGSFKVGASTFPLTKGPANNLAGFLIGVTDDLRVREVGL